jgi:hypothetical protein
MLRIEVLLAALLVSSPTLYEALVTGDTSVDTALIRFLLAIPVCGIGLLMVRKLFDAYASHGSNELGTGQAGQRNAASSAGSAASPNRRREDSQPVDGQNLSGAS